MTTRRRMSVAALALGALMASTLTPAVGQSPSPASPPPTAGSSAETGAICAAADPARSSPPAGSSPAPEAAAASSPSLVARRFETEGFSVSFGLPEDWYIGVDARNALQLIGPGESVFVNLAVLDAPIDPDDPEGRTPVNTEPCAAAFIDWLARHPYLEASAPEAVSLGGVAGHQIDVILAPPSDYNGCGPGCMFVLRVVPEPAEIDRIAMDTNEKDRYIALDVDGGVLIVNAWTPDANPATGGSDAAFEEGLVAAQAVLDSLVVEPR